MIEKILAAHSGDGSAYAGKIVDVSIDIRAARDFGGANVVKNLRDHKLRLADPAKTIFTFDCNPTGSDQKYAVNQHYCRIFARENGIKVYDIDAGIGTHLLIDRGYVAPGSTAVSTDSHANILGAIGAFGQGMGDMDIAAAWHKGKVWFKVPPSVKITLKGTIPENVSAKDIILNLLARFGANTLLGYSIELYGDAVKRLDLDERITIASMATEMGAIILLIPPDELVIDYCRSRSPGKFTPLYADEDARYEHEFEVEAQAFKRMVSRPGEPHDAVALEEVAGTAVDSAFIGSCTNGRMRDMREAAAILAGKRVAPGVVLKIVPATDEIWNQCLSEGIIDVFKKAGALVSNAGCAGCAAGQVGQNGAGEVTVSTGNRNFPGKQGKGSVYLASPAIVAASALAGYITAPGLANEKIIPPVPVTSTATEVREKKQESAERSAGTVLQGRVWKISRDNIDTDMIYHNSHLAVTDIREMGRYAFGNLPGYEDFSLKAAAGDIVVTGKNFGSGSSRQQAVDCFLSIGIGAIVAESFGAIYERNAINAAFPILTCSHDEIAALNDGDNVRIDLRTGTIENLTSGVACRCEPMSDVQLDIYRRGGLLA